MIWVTVDVCDHRVALLCCSNEALNRRLQPCHFTPFVSHYHVLCPMMNICLYEIFTLLKVCLYIIIRSQTYITTLYSLCGLVRVTAEVICIITTASAVSTAVTRHGINITLRSGKIKSNPSLQQLSARPRCLPVSHINSVSPSLRGRCRSYLSANECKNIAPAGWPVALPGAGVY